MPYPISHDPTGRRTFLKGALLGAGAGAAALAPVASRAAGVNPAPAAPRPEEWRNRHPEMAYRRLGRTGFMISELVLGGSGPLNNPEKAHLHEEAIDRGVNYLDSSSRYGRGDSERGWGVLLGRPGMRERLFVATKMAEYGVEIDRVTREIFDGLPSEKKAALERRAAAMIEERQVRKPGYFLQFYSGHGRELEGAYLSHLIKVEYGALAKWRPLLERKFAEALEGSLQRLGTDHVDVLHFPHGIRMPEELEDECHRELADRFKREGKVRFHAFSCHTDQPRILLRAAELGHVDVAMVAYNIANQSSMEVAIERAARAGIGVIAMKAAAGVNPISPQLRPAPAWRIEKLHQTLPGEMSLPVKGYLWALQNPNISAVISEIPFQAAIAENLTVVGRKVDLLPV